MGSTELQSQYLALMNERHALIEERKGLDARGNVIRKRLDELEDWRHIGLIPRAKEAWEKAQRAEFDAVLPKVTWAQDQPRSFEPVDMVIIRVTPKYIYVRAPGEDRESRHCRSHGKLGNSNDGGYGSKLDVEETLKAWEAWKAQ